MSTCLYILTNITDVTMRLDVFHHIMSKIFVMNDFICLFYFEMSFLQIIIIDMKYL